MYLTQEQNNDLNNIFKNVFKKVINTDYISEVEDAIEDGENETIDYLMINNFSHEIVNAIVYIYDSYIYDTVELYLSTLNKDIELKVIDFNEILEFHFNKKVVYEEDEEININTIVSNKESIGKTSVKDCSNQNYITLEDYTEEDNPIQIYLENSKGKFEKSLCITLDELRQHFKSDIESKKQDLKIPSNIMTIYKAINYEDTTGRESFATGKIVVKIPPSNIYITFGSANRIFKEYSKNKVWFALPLFNKKRRRIGNLDEFLGSSSDHGQIKGHLIYKIYTMDEIKSGIEVKETSEDYPEFLYENTVSLYDLLGKRIDNKFIEVFINELISVRHKKTYKISEFLGMSQQNGIIRFRKSGILISIKLGEPMEMTLESDKKFKFEFEGDIIKANKTFTLKNILAHNKIKFF